MDRYRIKPGAPVDLHKLDPDDRSLFKGKKEGAADELAESETKLEALQAQLDGEHKRSLLVILQAMDTGGKDGTIRHVFHGVNPQGVRVASFKVPTPEELDHDYLWRVHQRTPARGEIVIFNRSHYEDVLVVRVHKLIDEKTWRRRYEEINDFERMLHASGTIILKFFLHISREEQKKRLLERVEDQNKNWKISESDLRERRLWNKYVEAYNDALAATSKEHAPWYVIPANHKWYRNLVVSRILVKTLGDQRMKYPKAAEGIRAKILRA